MSESTRFRDKHGDVWEKVGEERPLYKPGSETSLILVPRDEGETVPAGTVMGRSLVELAFGPLAAMPPARETGDGPLGPVETAVLTVLARLHPDATHQATGDTAALVDDAREIAAAVHQAQAGPCMDPLTTTFLPHGEHTVRCELVYGHQGGHRCGHTTWIEREH